MATTPRWALRYPVGSDVPDVPLWMQRLATDLDGVAMDDQGLLAARPAAGQAGRYYHAVDDTTAGPNGTLARDNGAAWINVMQAPTAPPPTDPAANVAGLRTLGTGAQQAAAGNDPRLSDQRTPSNSSVTWAKLAAGLVGSGASTLAAGDDARFATIPKVVRSATKPYPSVVGMTWIYPADANGRLWVMRWNATDSRWERVGGEPLVVQAATVTVSGPDVSYNNPDGGAFPTLTIPFDGVYRVGFGCRRGNAQPSDANRLAAITINGAAGTWPLSLLDGGHYENTMTRAASDSLTLQFRTNDSAMATYSDVELWAVPVTIAF